MKRNERKNTVELISVEYFARLLIVGGKWIYFPSFERSIVCVLHRERLKIRKASNLEHITFNSLCKQPAGSLSRIWFSPAEQKQNSATHASVKINWYPAKRNSTGRNKDTTSHLAGQKFSTNASLIFRLYRCYCRLRNTEGKQPVGELKIDEGEIILRLTFKLLHSYWLRNALQGGAGRYRQSITLCGLPSVATSDARLPFSLY